MRIAWRNAVRTTGSPSRADEPAQERRPDRATSSSDSGARAARQHQAPGGGIDEQRLGLAQVVRPLPDRDLVGDQPVGRVGVRDAQQRLREAHQHDALLRGEVDIAAGRTRCRSCLRAAARGDHERDRVAADRFPLGVGQPHQREQSRRRPSFRPRGTARIDRRPGAESNSARRGAGMPSSGRVGHDRDFIRVGPAARRRREVVGEDPAVVECERWRVLGIDDEDARCIVAGDRLAASRSRCTRSLTVCPRGSRAGSE